MEPVNQTEYLDFIAGGGEMGALMRAKDWSKTSLGAPGKWPQSLRTTLSILLHSGFPMVLFWGPDLICFYNDAFRPSLGKEGKHPGILGIKGEDAWHEIWPTIKPWIDEVLNESKAIWKEDLLVPIYRNGKMEDVYWTFSYSPVNDESGKPAGVFVAVVETTGKVNTLKKIKESERRFRAMADNIPNLAWMANADGWIYWYNKKWYDYTGTTPEQMEGWGWQSVHDPQELPGVMERWQKSLQKGEPFEMIFPLKGRDGKFRQFLTRVLPLHDEEGKVTQWFGSNTDITRQIETELALKESEKRFRTMAEASDILIAMGDETSNATYFNKAWVNLTGRPMENLLKFGWADLVHPEDKERYVNIYLTAFEKKVPFSGEFRVLNKNGEYRWLLAQGPPLFRPDGSFAGYISSCMDITELKNATRKIEENERDLRSMVLESPIGICLMDAPTRVAEIVNESFVEIAGKPLDAIVGKFYWDTFAEARPYYEKALTDVVENGTTYFASEVRLMLIRHGKEEIIYVTFVYAPLKDAGGKVKKVAIWVLDNTKQVLARQKIEEAEQKARLAINSAELGLYEIVYASDAIITDNRFKEIWGFDRDATRNEYAAVIHPDDLPIRAEAHLASLVTGQLDYQARIIWKDKSIRWVRITGTVIYDEEKNPFKLIGVVQDITNSVTARIKLEEREQRFSDLIEQAPVAACVMRGENFIVEIANEKLLELWDRTKNQMIGKPIFDALPEVARMGYEELLAGVYTTGIPYFSNEHLLRIFRKGKMEDVYVNFVYHPLYNTDKKIDGVIAIATDCTQQVLAKRKIEEVVKDRTRELQQVNESLEKMNKELQAFAYISSHDLQEPLRKIQTFATQILEKEYRHLSDTGKDKFIRMQNAAERMQKLIEDLLAYSRTNTADRKFEITNLQYLIEEVKNDLKEELQQKNATIETIGTNMVNIIPFQFRQLLYNLISNSLKFSDQGRSPHIKIKTEMVQGDKLNNVKLENETTYCHLRISDNGIGFEQVFSEKIFEVFQRLHGRDKYSGTGIGLAIVKKIVENHNGMITATGKLNKGATFDIYIPAAGQFEE